MNTPPRPSSTSGLFSKSEFVYEPHSDSYACPGQQRLARAHPNSQAEDTLYRAEADTCEGCALKEQCTTSKNGRSITRSKYEAEYERQREHAKTPEAVMGRVLRGIIAEGKFGEAVRHGLKEMRYVGEDMALMQSRLVAAILNFKRYLRVKPVGSPA